MILSDYSIKTKVASGEIGIEPYDEARVQPASVDLLLGADFKIFVGPVDGEIHAIDPEKPIDRHLYAVANAMEELWLYPHYFILATTVEKITLPNDVGARIEGKSSLARLGISIHSTGGFIDPGFSGQITLEISSVMPHPIILRPGMKIAQIGFYVMDRPVRKPYGHPDLGSKYQGQEGATVGRYDLNEPVTAKSKRCAACGGRGWRLDLDERCENCNPEGGRS